MIQIDIEMPRSCSECPFKDQYNGCLIVPLVPAWQKEIKECQNRRSEHCPLMNYEEDVKFNMKMKASDFVQELEKFPQDILDKVIISATGGEGWGRVNYLLMFEE